MFSHELPQPVGHPRRSSNDRFVVQVPVDVGGEFRCRPVPSGAVLFQRFHDDPIQVATDELAQFARISFAGETKLPSATDRGSTGARLVEVVLLRE